MSNIYISGASEQGLPEGSRRQPTNQPPAPQTVAYQDPKAMSEYLRGPLSTWLEQNRASYPNFTAITDQITTASASLNAEKRTPEGAVSEYNALMETLGFTVSEGQKAEQMDAGAQGIVAKASNQVTSLTSQIENAQKQIGEWKEKLGQLPPESPVLPKAQKTLNSAEALVSNLQGQMTTAQSTLASAQRGSTDIHQMVSSAGGAPERDAMQQISTRYQAFVAAHTKTLPDLSTQIQNTFTSLEHLVNPRIAPPIAAAPTPTAAPAASNASTPAADPNAQGQSQSFYFDLGSMPIWNMVNWNVTPPVIDMTKLAAYIDPLVSGMKQNGQTNVVFSFAQLGSIAALASGATSGYAPDDSVGMLYKSVPGATNIFQDIVSTFQGQGMSTTLSFGGQSAGASDWQIAGDPATAADTLATFVKSMKFSSVDFDIEDSNFVTSNPPGTMNTFFSELSSKLAHNPPMTLTALAGLANTQSGGIYSTFFQPNANNFNSWFDGLNLMTYGAPTGPDGQFYLDPSNSSWGIEQWIDQVGKQNASKIHIGFTDAPMANGQGYCQANCGGDWSQYGIPAGTPSGTAAGMIYAFIIKKLESDGYISNASGIGQPFWWPYDTSSNYNNPGSFASTTIQDFYTYLNANEPALSPAMPAPSAPPSSVSSIEEEIVKNKNKTDIN